MTTGQKHDHRWVQQYLRTQTTVASAGCWHSSMLIYAIAAQWVKEISVLTVLTITTSTCKCS